MRLRLTLPLSILTLSAMSVSNADESGVVKLNGNFEVSWQDRETKGFTSLKGVREIVINSGFIILHHGQGGTALSRESITALNWKRMGASEGVAEPPATAPAAVDPNLKAGFELLRKGDARGAVVEFDRAIARDPRNPDAYLRRAQAQLALRDFRAALADYNKSLELDPRQELAYLQRGIAHFSLGDRRAAFADCDSALELNPRLPEAYLQRGNMKSHSNDPQGAIADLTRAIELKPDYAEAYRNRGVIRVNNLRDQGGEADMDRARALDPKLPMPQRVTKPIEPPKVGEAPKGPTSDDPFPK